MIAEVTSRFSRSALTIAVAVSVSFPALCAGQNNSSVYTNPRAGSDDPRVGLKAGLYDAGEASFGMERLISLPKPAGFAVTVMFEGVGPVAVLIRSQFAAGFVPAVA